jgi:hypothetical protein
VRFWLGTHRPNWLGLVSVPLFVSQRTLGPRRSLPRASCEWALDSGGFSELSMYGRWQTSADAYEASIRRYQDEIGMLEWAAPQDYMCEPVMLAKTGLTIREHQARTIASYLDLSSRGLPVIPVLQGWMLADYARHVEDYDDAGVDLRDAALVGLGSVCRRQATSEIHRIVWELRSLGLRLHGFGVKTSGLGSYGDLLASADSLAWSYAARHRPPLPGCKHSSCANCPVFALQWRDRILATLDDSRSIFSAA